MPDQFAFVQYDNVSKDLSDRALKEADDLRAFIETNLKPGRASSLALTKLEECFMWIGKQIRDEQLARNKQQEK